MTAKKKITLKFQEGDYDFIQLVCRRKLISLEDYIIENSEWDDLPECISCDKKPSKEICEDCEFAPTGISNGCPDYMRCE